MNLYSDLLLHHMGATLADNIVQGNAGPDEFRTTPLWGVGQRLFFLHDGRTDDLMVAILDHFSPRFSDGGDNPAKDGHSYLYDASEANAVIERFNSLSARVSLAILSSRATRGSGGGGGGASGKPERSRYVMRRNLGA